MEASGAQARAYCAPSGPHENCIIKKHFIFREIPNLAKAKIMNTAIPRILNRALKIPCAILRILQHSKQNLEIPKKLLWTRNGILWNLSKVFTIASRTLRNLRLPRRY